MIHGNGPTAPAGRRIFNLGFGGKAAGPFNLPVWRSPVTNRTKAPTQAQLYSQRTLMVAAAFLHEITAFEYDQCKALAGASGYTWKDQFYAMLYGTGVEFVDKNGVHWYGRRILNANIQQLLDSISEAEGGMLVRTPTGWASLLPGTPGKVLTIDLTTSLPNWLDPAGGNATGPAMVYAPVPASTWSQNFASIGELFTAQADIVVTGLSLGLNPPAAGCTYKFAVAKFDPATQKLLEAPAYTAAVTLGTGSHAQYPFAALPSPKAISAGESFLVMVTRTDGTATSPTSGYLTTVTTAAPYMDHPVRTSICRTLASLAPTTADTWGTVGGFLCWAISYYPG